MKLEIKDSEIEVIKTVLLRSISGMISCNVAEDNENYKKIVEVHNRIVSAQKEEREKEKIKPTRKTEKEF